jgi:hypothetical protein
MPLNMPQFAEAAVQWPVLNINLQRRHPVNGTQLFSSSFCELCIHFISLSLLHGKTSILLFLSYVEDAMYNAMQPDGPYRFISAATWNGYRHANSSMLDTRTFASSRLP